MTPAQLNILINVRAKQARDQINKLMGAIRQLDAAIVQSSAGLSRFVGQISALAMPVGMASTALADLSRNLAAIGKSGANRSISTLGTNAAAAAAELLEAAVAAELLEARLVALTATANGTAASLRSLTGAAAAFSGLTAAGTAAGAAGAAAAAGMGAAAAASSKTAKAVNNSSNSFNRHSMSTVAAGKEMVKYTNFARAGSKELVQLNRNANIASDGTYRLSNASTEFVGKGGKAQALTTHWSQDLKTLGDRSVKFGSQMQWAGRQMALYFTAPIALAIGMGAKWQLDLERQQTNLKKVYDAGLGDNINDSTSKTARQFQILTEELRKLSDETGTSQEEITKMAAAWAQAGYAGKDLLEYTRLTNQAMIVGDTTAEKATEGMQSLALQWGFTAKETSKGVSEIQGALQNFNLASNITQVTVNDLFDAMQRTGAQARDAGLSFDETTAILTSLIRVTGTAATAGNGLKSISTNIRASSKSMPVVVKKVKDITNGLLDMDSAAYQAMDTMDKFRYIAKVSSQLDTQSLTELNFALFGKYQASRGAQINKDLLNIAGNIVKVEKALSEGTAEGSRSWTQWRQELETYMTSNPQKFKIASNSIKNSMMEIGVVALPYILTILQTIEKVIKAFSNLPDGIQKAAIAVGVFIALAAPLAMLFGATNVLIGTFAKTLAWFGRTFTKAGKQAAGGGKDTVKSSSLIASAASKIRKSVISGITTPFKAAAGVVKKSTAHIAATAKGGSAATSAAWAAGMAGIPSSTAAAGNAAVTAQTVTGKRMLNSTAGMTRAEVLLYAQRGMLTTEAIASSGYANLIAQQKADAAKVAQTAKTGQLQLAMTAKNQQAVLMAEQVKWAESMALQKRMEAAKLSQTIAHQKQVLALQKTFANGELGQRRVAETQKKIIEAESQLIRARQHNAMYTQMAIAARVGESKITAAVVAGNKARVAAAAAGAKGMASANAAGAAAAAGAAKGGAKKGMRGGGAAGIILTSLLFIPPGKFKEWGTKVKELFTKEGGGIQRLLSKLGMNSMKGFLQGIGKFLRKGGPIAIAIGAIFAMFGQAWDEIKSKFASIASDKNIPLLAKPFVVMVESIILAISKLPKVIADVFRAVVSFIGKAAKKVYEFFSYFNPFARHSPSLVENVQNGMAVVTGEFADASKSIQNSLRGAYGMISKVGKASAGLTLRAKNIETEDRNKNLNRADPTGGAARNYAALEAQASKLEATMVKLNAAMIRQQRVIDGLESQVKAADLRISQMQKTMELLQKAADATADALDKAKEKLDYYANAPIKGMRAMSDAIFENEMAQKRLRLEIMKLEEAGESIDGVEDKFARLQGQIETLSGTRMELQAKGAGSDILSTYDKMIADLKAQQNEALESGPSTAIDKLNNQLDELQRKGEMLDLENSLKFDPLTRQIEQLVNTEKELDFSTIVAGVTTYKAQVEGLTAANDIATAAVTAQQTAIDAATVARDALNDQLEVEEDKLQQIKDAYDATSTAVGDLNSAMEEITSAASTINARLDEIEQAQKEAADAAKDHKDALEDAAGALEEMGDIEAPEIDDSALQNSLNNLFPDVEKFFDGLGTKVKNWIKDKLGKVGTWIKDTLLPGIGNALRALPGELTSAISYLTGYMAGLIVKGIVASAKLVAGAAKALFYDLPNAIWEAISSIDWGSVIGTVIGYLVNPSKWGEAVLKIAVIGTQIVQGLLDGISSAVNGIWNWINNHVVQPLINGFKDGLGIHSPSTVFAGFGRDIITGLYNGLVEKIGVVLEWFRGVPGWIKDKLGNLLGLLREKGGNLLQGLKDGAIEKWNGFIDWVNGIPGWIKGKLGNLGGTLVQSGRDLIQGLMNGAGELLPKIGEWFLDKIPGWIKTPFKKAMGIASPSKVFAEYGNNIGEGLIIGIEDQLANIESASSSIADAATSGINNMTPLSAPAVKVATEVTDAPASVSAPTAAGPDAAAITAQGDAALLAWQNYYAQLDALKASHNAAEVAAQATQNANELAALVAHHSAILVQHQTHFATITGAANTFRSTELASQIAWYSSQIAEFTKFAENYKIALDALHKSGIDSWDNYRLSVTDIFQNLATSLQDTVNGPITDVFNSLAGLLVQAEENFARTVENIRGSWLGIQEATAVPVRFTIDKVYNNGLMGVWNNVAELIGANKMTNYPVTFASGGPVKGPGTETSDSIPALLSRNEYVLSADAVRRAGGVTNLNRFNFGKSAPQGMFGIGGDYNVKSTNGPVRKLATGGPADPGSPTWKAFQRGHLYAKRISPGPYRLGGSSGGSRNGFTDCSGFQSEVADVIMGGPGGQRKWATGSFPGGGGAQGNVVKIGNQVWVKGLGAGHSIGISVPHAAGTLSGIPGLPNVNIESGGGTGGGATYGGPATGANDPQFPTRYHLAITDGMFVAATPGAGVSMMEILGSMVEPGLKSMMDTAKAYPIKGLADVVPSKTAEAWNTQTRKKIEDEAKKLDAMGPPMGGGDYSSVERWRPMVIAALKRQGFAATKREQDAMLGQIWDESRGNPNAINNWDVNAQNGTPSQGLLQTIPSTFETWRDPEIPGGITDPWANMNAALRYYKDNYGTDLTTHWGRGKGGYDSGGLLPPTPNGFGTYYNHTGKPEAVLTSAQWDAIYEAARKPAITAEIVSEGFVGGMRKLFTANADGKVESIINTATEVALQSENKKWIPLTLDSLEDAAKAAEGTTSAVNASASKVTSAVDANSIIGENQLKALSNIASLLQAGLSAVPEVKYTPASKDDKGNVIPEKWEIPAVTFGMIAPLIESLGGLIEMLPDAEPTYVDWAGTNRPVTEQMRQEKRLNDMANAGKGMYMAFKTIGPSLLKHTAKIGSAIEQLVIQDGAAWSAAIAGIAAGNPAAIAAAVALAFKAIFTLLPAILEAIIEIVPAIFKAIKMFITKFSPDSVYSYDSYDAANKAVNDNIDAIRNGASAPYFKVPNETIQNNQNSTTVFNIYGDISLPNVTNSSGAQNLVNNLESLAG